MKLRPEQQGAVAHINAGDHTLLIGPTGSGKTATILHALAASIQEEKHKVLIACPPKVVKHWQKEADLWGLDLNVVSGVGSPRDRLKKLQGDFDIYVVSLNNFPWALEQDHGCTGLVLDELSRFRAGVSSKKLRARHKQFIYVIGCTATPVEENWAHLYGQCLAIDGGLRLGTRKDKFIDRYFTTGWNGYDLKLRPGAADKIMGRIKDMVYVLPDTKAQTLPPINEEVLWFNLPATVQEKHKKIAKDLVIELEDRKVKAVNLAVLSAKLRQIACGFIYDNDGEPIYIHDARYRLADVWIREHNGGVVVFDFVEDMLQMMRRHPDALVLGGEHGQSIDKILKAFKPGMFLFMHHRSGSHGVNGLQTVAHNLLFFSPIWSRDSTQQTIGRLWRTGQTHPVSVTTLAANNTTDSFILSRVDAKGGNMVKFLKSLTT